ncbi:MAG: cation:proton antiporter subunit C [Eubacteriales bacterium]
MFENLSQNYYQVVAVILFGIGFTALFLHRNLFKKVIGLNIMDGSVYLFLASSGYIHTGIAPIINQGEALYINPIPTGLVLTGIVVSVSMTAVSLALVQRLYRDYHTLDLDEILVRASEEA